MRICVNSLGLLNVLYILRHFLFHPFSPCTPICFLSQFCFRAILSESMFHSALVILFLHPWQYATVLLACQTSGVTTPGQLRAVLGLDLFLPGLWLDLKMSWKSCV